MQATVAVRYAATDERPGGSPGAAASSQRLPAELLAIPVLIIEDEAMIAWMLESLLEDMGFETLVVVASGEEALEAARRHPPGLIVSDINLGAGRLDGVGAAAKLRTMVTAPILFVTGYASAEAQARILQDVPGAPILRKPIVPDDLRRSVLNLVAGSRPN